MFWQYFGNYLVDRNKISNLQFKEVLNKQEQSSVKLGILAVTEKLMTVKQAEEINELQKKKDMRYGDIAIEKGYLLEEEVSYLLNKQDNSHLKFAQALMDLGIMTLNEIETNIKEFMAYYDYSDYDLDSLKSNNVERIIPLFVNIDFPYKGELISLLIRNVLRFISNNIRLKDEFTTNEYSYGNLAFQKMIGDQSLFVGFASKDKELLNIANPFAGEEFTEVDEDAFDSVCEFINCTNGLYASKLSEEAIFLDMEPPLYSTNATISSNGDICVIPLVIEDIPIDLLIVLNHQTEISREGR